MGSMLIVNLHFWYIYVLLLVVLFVNLDNGIFAENGWLAYLVGVWLMSHFLQTFEHHFVALCSTCTWTVTRRNRSNLLNMPVSGLRYPQRFASKNEICIYLDHYFFCLIIFYYIKRLFSYNIFMFSCKLFWCTFTVFILFS